MFFRYSVARPIDTTIPKSDSQSSNLLNTHSGESITSATPAAAAATAASSSKEPVSGYLFTYLQGFPV